MTRLHNMPLKTSQFAFDKARKVLLADASELGVRPGDRLVSIKLLSTHTGRVAFFEYDREAAIEAEFWDGELAEYRSKDGFASNLKIVIFNT